MMPLGDELRRPSRFPIVTAFTIALNGRRAAFATTGDPGFPAVRDGAMPIVVFDNDSRVITALKRIEEQFVPGFIDPGPERRRAATTCPGDRYGSQVDRIYRRGIA